VAGSPFSSKNIASRVLGIGRNLIDYFIDSGKVEGVKGNYLYSRQLKDIEIKSLLKKSAGALLRQPKNRYKNKSLSL
jgi:hypothetical protein